MIEFISGLFSNQIFAGGVGIGLVGGAIASLRKLPKEIWWRIKAKFITSVEILSDDQVFHWFSFWLNKQDYAQKSRSLTVTSSKDEYLIFNPSPGHHVFRHKGTIFWLNRTREVNSGQNGGWWRESYTLSALTRNPQVLRDLIEEVKKEYNLNPDGKISVYQQIYDGWSLIDRLNPRPIDSVILNGEISIQDLLVEINNFYAKEKWYIDKGVPYRRGYLLYGPPGTGKTSTIFAIASELCIPIYILTLSGSNLTDNQLRSLILNIPKRAILAIEDIDSAFVERKNQNGITFSGLLNILDGIGAKEGRILFLTTNHIEKLDPALIRTGRIDRKIMYHHATHDQIRKMILKFKPAWGEKEILKFIAETRENQSMSDVQERLMQYE